MNWNNFMILDFEVIQKLLVFMEDNKNPRNINT
jgi:hypothetical protein